MEMLFVNLVVKNRILLMKIQWIHVQNLFVMGVWMGNVRHPIIVPVRLAGQVLIVQHVLKNQDVNMDFATELLSVIVILVGLEVTAKYVSLFHCNNMYLI